MGKVSEQSISEAKKKYEGNGKTPLGILTYLIEDKIVADCLEALIGTMP